MTAAQKQNIARFKAVQAEAKKLKAKNKNLTHIQAVKQAWAIMLHKAPKKKKVSGLDKVIKKGSKTTVLYTKKEKKKVAPKKKVSQGVLFGIKKKAAKKPSEKDILKKVHSAKSSSKTLYNKLDKLDEAQHKHMSGMNKDIFAEYIKTKELIIKIEKGIKNTPILADKYGYNKIQLKIAMNKLKNWKKEQTEHLKELKKLL